VLSIFGPRNAADTGRVLIPGGILIIAAPGADHMRELRRPLGMIGIDQRKPQRLASTYRDYTRFGVTTVNYRLSLDHTDLTALVSMGPSARHITPQALAARIRSLSIPFTVTFDLRIRVFQRPRDLAWVTTPLGKR
jgi:23S rRNA (guanine745-N1)-methyltransferase